MVRNVSTDNSKERNSKGSTLAQNEAVLSYVTERIPPLVGLKEFAQIIGWDKARLSTKYSRQKEGKKVRPVLPEPIQIVSATPIWTLEQANQYRMILSENLSIKERKNLMKKIDIKTLITNALEMYMRTYLLQVRNVFDEPMFHEISLDEDKGEQLREIIENAEIQIRKLGYCKGINHPEVVPTPGFEAYLLWKALKGEGDVVKLTKEKYEIIFDEESVENFVKFLQLKLF